MGPISLPPWFRYTVANSVFSFATFENMAFPTPLSKLIFYCEQNCVKECCGIDAFDFAPVHIASWLQTQDDGADAIVSQLKQQLDDFRGEFAAGYESDEEEMNHILTAEQVTQLATQLSANLDHAVKLMEQSTAVAWNPESAAAVSEHQPQLGNEFVRALSWRYACKKFDPQRQVSAGDLETILKAVNLSASSYGLQPFQLVVVQDRELQEKLMPVSYNQPQVRDASAVIVFSIRTDIDDDYIRSYARRTEQMRNLDEGTLDAYADQMSGSIMGLDAEKRAAWAGKQTYILMGTALAACAMLGIDSCPMEGFIADQYDQILELPKRNLHAALVLPIGYRADDDPQAKFAKVRMPLDEMVIRLG